MKPKPCSKYLGYQQLEGLMCSRWTLYLNDGMFDRLRLCTLQIIVSVLFEIL